MCSSVKLAKKFPGLFFVLLSTLDIPFSVKKFQAVKFKVILPRNVFAKVPIVKWK